MHLKIALPRGTGPAPRLRRRIIARVPGISRTRRIRWQAGTVVPGVGPTARLRRQGRALAEHRRLIGAGLAGTAAVAFARRRSHDGSAEQTEQAEQTAPQA